MGEKQGIEPVRTMLDLESRRAPLRHAEQNTRSPEEFKCLYKGLERIWVRVFTILTAI